MQLSATPVTVQEILPWRDLYRQEMNCQIVRDSFHARQGWTQEYRLTVDDAAVGYGSVVVGGPWQGQPTVFEFYVLPQHRWRVFDLFETLLAASGAEAIEAQSNDTLLTMMLHTFADNVTAEKILFHDRLTTHLAAGGAQFRAATPEDETRMFAHQVEPVGDWLLELDGAIAATGGLLFHYNRPYGDLYMEVAEPFRRRGLGAYLVQELKRVCYEMGSVPAARCDLSNIASRQTLQKAGFVPCGHLVRGVSAAGGCKSSGYPFRREAG
jgi:GNAT superfamily N-acetyltransferase